jgi:Kef-type K+ transport system membrane component KefB
VENFSSVLLLPLFFVFTGLRTQIGLLHDLQGWLLCLLIIAVASLGKLGGTAVAARFTGMSWRESLQLGALMNTRGLMELIALNIGYDLGILPPHIFTMLVIMALATTMLTGPLLTFFGKIPSHKNNLPDL